MLISRKKDFILLQLTDAKAFYVDHSQTWLIFASGTKEMDRQTPPLTRSAVANDVSISMEDIPDIKVEPRDYIISSSSSSEESFSTRDCVDETDLDEMEEEEQEPEEEEMEEEVSRLSHIF